MIMCDIVLTASFNEKFVPISKTLAAPIENVPFTTDGIEVNEKSLFLFSSSHRIFEEFKKCEKL